MGKRYNLEDLETSKEVANEIIKRYQEGHTLVEISRFYKISYYQARQVLIDNKIKLRSRWTRIK